MKKVNYESLAQGVKETRRLGRLVVISITFSVTCIMPKSLKASLDVLEVDRKSESKYLGRSASVR